MICTCAFLKVFSYNKTNLKLETCLTELADWSVKEWVSLTWLSDWWVKESVWLTELNDWSVE